MKSSRINMARWVCEIIDTWLKVSLIGHENTERKWKWLFSGIRDNNSILSIDLNQDEDEIIIERDSPGYSSFQCLSDIGMSLVPCIAALGRTSATTTGMGWRVSKVLDGEIALRRPEYDANEICKRGNRWVGSWTFYCLNFEINGIFLLFQ